MTTFARRLFLFCLITSLLICLAVGQSNVSSQSSVVVPRLVNFSGKAIDGGKVITGMAGATFAIYSEESGGSPLWLETQNIQADGKGNYTVQLGATKPDGLPLDLFTSGEARWLGVAINGGQEQPRVLLLSVPYALKAADAETVGGLPASAFMLAAPPTATGPSNDASASTSTNGLTPAATGTGTADFVPLWTNSTGVLGNSVLFQSGTGSTAMIGINITSPDATLDVNGGGIFRGLLNLPATGVATAASGENSEPLNFTASAYNSGTGSAVNQRFRWKAEPTGNNTATTGGTLNLLYGAGSNAPAETGLRIAKNGQITFASGQSFPGTISGVTAGTDLTGGGTSGNVTLNLNTSALNSTYAQLGAANTFTGNQTVNGNVSAAGVTTTAASGGITSTMTGSGNGIAAITGLATATGGAGFTFGVVGQSASNSGRGVWGLSSGSGGIGVLGENNNGPGTGVEGKVLDPSYGSGVYGLMAGPSSSGAAQLTRGGVWGDTNIPLPRDVAGSITFAAVIGTADDAHSGIFINNSPSGYATLSATDLSTGGDPFVAGGPNGFCYIDTGGNLDCFGSSEAVVSTDGGARMVAMSAIGSPMNWFEDAGSAQLVNGAAVVNLDRDFIQTANTETDYKVFPVPNGDCKGLYVTNKTATSFEVRELGGGTSSVAFDYRIMAIRRNYEQVRFADRTSDYNRIEQMRRQQMRAAGVRPISHDETNAPTTMPAKQASFRTAPAVGR